MWGTKLIMAIMLSPALCFAQSNSFSLNEASSGLPHLSGRRDKSGYPYTTAGDRLYAIGDQAGEFPELGFHVEGQMGGIWQHPIKLMNGFRLTVREAKTGFEKALDKCDSFITCSFATRFIYTFPQQNFSVTRTEFVPDHIPLLAVEYVFKNDAAVDRDFNLELNAAINLMPVWLGERSGMIDSTDEVLEFDKRNCTLLCKDRNNPWYAGISFDDRDVDYTGVTKTTYRGNGIDGRLTATIHIAKGSTARFRFYISGSVKDTSEIRSNIAFVKGNLRKLFDEKRRRYGQLEKNASIDIPDEQMKLAYQWGKYTSDWLVRDVPGLGKGMSAGLPDYPWFFSNDQAYTFDALVGTVQPDIFYSSWKMLKKISDAANDSSGRIIHEASSNGAVFDKGRMEESQLHIIAAWNIFKWTGNMNFLKENYAYGRRTWKWLQQHDTNHNLYIEGYGGVEIEGLNEEMLDVQVHTQNFLRVMSQMAFLLDDIGAAVDYKQMAEKLKAKINKEWWIPSENRYADFISSREKAISIIDAAIAKRTDPARNEWAVKKLGILKSQIQNNQYTDKGYAVYYNTSGILPLEEGMADTAKAIQALRHISFFGNRFGLYITGIERPDDVSIDEGSFRQDKAFNYGRAVMPAATASLVIAECRYGSPDTALTYVHKILNSFNYATPGTAYEVSPDYGMFLQAWNIRGFNMPVIQYFFGIDPMASKKEITLRPGMPDQWDHASIKNVLIGTNKFSFEYKRQGQQAVYKLQSTEDGWNLDLQLPAATQKAWVNGKAVKVKEGKIRLNKKDNIVRLLLLPSST